MSSEETLNAAPVGALNQSLQKQDKSGSQSWLMPLVIILTVLALGCLFVPNFMRTAHRRPYMSCRANLKNIATALECYATDNQGQFPATMDRLYPAYLKRAPYCDSNPALTYHYQTSIKQKKQEFLVSCAGQHQYYGPFLVYSFVGPGFPQYTSVDGLTNQ